MCPNDNILSAYVDNELEGKIKEIVEEHIENCNICKEKVLVLSKLSNEILRADFGEEYYDLSAKRVSNALVSYLESNSRSLRKDVKSKKVVKKLIPVFATFGLSLIVLFTFFMFWGYNRDVNISSSPESIQAVIGDESQSYFSLEEENFDENSESDLLEDEEDYKLKDFIQMYPDWSNINNVDY